MAPYPLLALFAAAVVVALELAVFRTGVLRMPAYWLSMVIVLAFMVPVDGWMSKLSNPIVVYSPKAISGVRFPWDIPLEEFAYAWAMITLVIILWERQRRRDEAPVVGPAPAKAPRDRAPAPARTSPDPAVQVRKEGGHG